MTTETMVDANWIIPKFMTQRQRIAYALFAAEQAVKCPRRDIWEYWKKPEAKNPHNAIRAIKKYIENSTEENKSTALKYLTCDSLYCSVMDSVRAALETLSDDKYSSCLGASFACSFAATAAYKTFEDYENVYKKIVSYGTELLKGEL